MKKISVISPAYNSNRAGADQLRKVISGQSNIAREGLRVIVAGAFNTAFGIAGTFLWTWLLVRLLPSQPASMTASATLVSTVINITVSFLT